MVNRHRYLFFSFGFCSLGARGGTYLIPLSIRICIYAYIHSYLLARLLVAAEELCMYVGGWIDG